MAHCLFNIFLLLMLVKAHRDCHTKISSGTAQLLRNGSSISSVSFNSITLELVVVVVVNSSSTTSNEALNPKASRLRARRQKSSSNLCVFNGNRTLLHYYTTPVLVCQNVTMCKLAYHALINNHTEKMPASK